MSDAMNTNGPWREHAGYCWPTCGCPDSDEFDWDGFAADINSDPLQNDVTTRVVKAQISDNIAPDETFVRTYDLVTDTEEWIGPMSRHLAGLVAEGLKGKRQTRVYRKSELSADK